MNDLSELVKTIQENISRNISRDAEEKLQLYVSKIKIKIDEIKYKIKYYLREYAIESKPVDVEPKSDKLVEGVNSAVKEGNLLFDSGRVVNEQAKTMHIKYKIQVDRLDGEIQLPQEIKEEELKKAILEDSGFCFTTVMTKKTAKYETKETDETLLTGFNSLASLFSKF